MLDGMSSSSRSLEKCPIPVIDTGPSVNDATNMFDPFISAKKKDIGLAVARSFVEAHEDSCGQKIIMTSSTIHTQAALVKDA
jgi:nitrogen-specific signal transduction histidine kinase